MNKVNPGQNDKGIKCVCICVSVCTNLYTYRQPTPVILI